MGVALDFAVAIVGAGPAGTTTALSLLRAAPQLRNQIVVIDAETFPRDKICAGAIGGRAVNILRELGVADAACAGVPIAGLRVTTSRGTLQARLPGAPIGYVVRRKRFDASLAGAVQDAGIACRYGEPVTGIFRHAEGLVLQLGCERLQVAAVVGADGVRSIVRKQLRSSRGKLYAQAAEVDTGRLITEEHDLLHFDLTRRDLPGYAWDFPSFLDDRPVMCRGVYRITRGLPKPSGTPPTARAALLEHLATRRVACVPWRQKTFAERGLDWHEPLAAPRLALIGEAAGIDPVLGEGIAQAIQYGHVAGPYLAKCIKQGDYRFRDFRATILKSRLGTDLRIRAAALKSVYGPQRPLLESWVTASTPLAHAGMHYFAGRHVPRRMLLAAAADLLQAAVRRR